MNPFTPLPNFTDDPLPEGLQPSRVQFIRKLFPELSGLSNAAGHAGDWLCWVHDRLFLEGWQIAAVRAELARAQRSVRVLTVTSGKGGVGKTTIVVNLAIAFAQRGRRVLVFDADLGMANSHVFAGVNPKATILDVIDGRVALEDILQPGPAGVQIICGVSGVGRLADLGERVLEVLGHELLRVAADFDVLLIDTGAGVGPTVMHFVALAGDAIVVATPNLASTLDAYGVIKVTQELRLKTRLHLLVNEVEDQAQAASVLGRITGCAHRFLQMTPGELGFLYRDPAFEAANQQRRPLILADPGSSHALRFAEIAARLDEQPEQNDDTFTNRESTHHAAA
jgi:flagellar biosynthesis protein FlhG